MKSSVTLVKGKNRDVYETSPDSKLSGELGTVAVDTGSSIRWRYITDYCMSLDMTLIAPGDSYPFHKHSELVEYFFVIDGNLTIRTKDELGENIIRLRKNSFFTAKPGVIHSIKNEENCYARMLCLKTLPGKTDDFMKMLEEDRISEGPGNERPVIKYHKES